MTVRDILEVKGHAVHTTAASAIDEAASATCRVNVGARVELDEHGNTTAILSECDLLTRVLPAHRDPTSTTVGDVMRRRVFGFDEGGSPSDAMQAMTCGRCRYLPVMAENKVTGLVSIGDLVRAICGDQERELRALHKYVEGRYPG